MSDSLKKDPMPKEDLIENVKRTLNSKHEIIFCYIYGSFLENNHFRDIDIAIYVNQKRISSEQAFDYTFQLSLDLSKQTGFEIDIQMMNYAPLGFQHSVLKNGELLFSKDESLRLNLIENVSLEYMDFFELSMQYIHDIAFY